MFRYENVTGGTGNNLWAFNGGVAPDNINLNNAVGVQGIQTWMPADNRFFFLFIKVGADSVAAFAIDDAPEFFRFGLSDDGIAKVAAMIAGNATENFYTETFIGGAFQEAASPTAIGTSAVNLSTVERFSGDIVTGENTRSRLSHVDAQLSVEIGATAPMKRTMNNLGWFLTSLGASKFAILKDGKICTNQYVAGVRLAPTGNLLEICDETGVSLGFVELITKV